MPIPGRSKTLQPAYARFAEAFRVSHDVRLRDRDEVFSSEESTDFDLMPQRFLQHGTGLSGTNVLLFVVKFHRSQSGVAPAHACDSENGYKDQPNGIGQRVVKGHLLLQRSDATNQPISLKITKLTGIWCVEEAQAAALEKFYYTKRN
jgi:hypothetical protein